MITIEADTYQEDGIIITDYKDILVDIDTIKRTFNKRQNLANNEKSLVVLKGNALLSLDKEVRDFASSSIVENNTKAIAFVPTSKAAHIIARIFISMKSTPFPTNVFEDVDTAKEWLLSLD